MRAAGRGSAAAGSAGPGEVEHAGEPALAGEGGCDAEEGLLAVEGGVALEGADAGGAALAGVEPAGGETATASVVSRASRRWKPAAARRRSFSPGGVKMNRPMEARAAISAASTGPVMTTGSV